MDKDVANDPTVEVAVPSEEEQLAIREQAAYQEMRSYEQYLEKKYGVRLMVEIKKRFIAEERLPKEMVQRPTPVAEAPESDVGEEAVDS